jgi:hypothetical protein
MAEDLGVITSDVVALRCGRRAGRVAAGAARAGAGALERGTCSGLPARAPWLQPPPAPAPPLPLPPRREAIGAPGMVVLQFAWGGGPNNVHLPHMHYENSFCYPGTHDNETSVGWFKGSANAQDKVRRLREGGGRGGGGGGGARVRARAR